MLCLLPSISPLMGRKTALTLIWASIGTVPPCPNPAFIALVFSKTTYTCSHTGSISALSKPVWGARQDGNWFSPRLTLVSPAGVGWLHHGLPAQGRTSEPTKLSILCFWIKRRKIHTIFFKLNFNLLKNGKSMDVYVHLAGLLTWLHSSCYCALCPIEKHGLVLFFYPITLSSFLQIKKKHKQDSKAHHPLNAYYLQSNT